ncbi:MAG: NADPH-dependent FMN reductase [Bacteroidota bacterium]
MSETTKTVIAIPGSTRTHSTHLNLIRRIEELAAGKFHLIVYRHISELPHFNPDLDNDTPPENVIDFRKQLKASDGILICTPEYAMGVPGTLKNALDWTVSSADFYRKPTALITASSQGYKGHAALMETLNIIGSNITNDTQLIIPFVKTVVAQDGTIADGTIEAKVNRLITSFQKLMI